MPDKRGLFHSMTRMPTAKQAQRGQTLQKKRSAAVAEVKELRSIVLEKALPPVLQLMFLLYPFVNTVAFEGFPCYDFEGLQPMRGWLRADVSIECYTPEQWRLTGISWLAVSIYPIGLWLVTLMLLLLSVNNPHSPLARACSFLYQEYDDACFWWELSTRHIQTLETRNIPHRALATPINT